MKTPPKILLAVLLITAAVFFTSLFFGFTNWDDESHFLQNPDVINFDLKGIFSDMINRTYIPLPTLTLAIEHRIFGFNPFIFHLDNMILHLVITILVFQFALRLGLNEISAGIAAFIFGVHPLHVESVAWITERKGLLYTLFYLFALNSYWKYLESHRKKYYVVSLLWAGLSILSKPMALSLPLILLLCDWFRGRELTLRVWAEKIPFVVLVMPIALLTYALNARVIQHDFSESLLTWLWTFTFYLQKFFMPLQLLPLYKLPRPIDYSNPAYVISLGMMVLIVGSLIYFRKSRWMLFAFLYYAFSIFFLLRFDDKVDITIVADRYMYLPSLGFCIFIGWGLGKVQAKLELSGRQYKRLAYGCLLAGAMFLAFGAHSQSLIWKNGHTLWNSVIKDDNPPALAFYNRGILMEREKNLEQALSDYGSAIKENSEYAEAYNARGHVWMAEGHGDLALADLNKAVEINPKFAKAYNNRGIILSQAGLSESAISDYDKAIEHDPNFALAYNNRGLAHYGKQKYEQALSDFDQSLKLDAQNADTIFNRGNVYKALGENDRALGDYSAAIKLNPREAKFYNNRGNIYTSEGEFESAVADYKIAIKLQPNNTEALNNLGVAYQAMQKGQLALESFNQAIAIDPRFVAAYVNRGDYFNTNSNYEDSRSDFGKALELDPQNAPLYYKRSLVYAKQKDWKNAIQDAVKAKELGCPYMDVYIAKLEKLQRE